jgi:hypothetical protein
MFGMKIISCELSRKCLSTSATSLRNNEFILWDVIKINIFVINLLLLKTIYFS